MHSPTCNKHQMKLSLDFTFWVMLRFKDFLWRPCQWATTDFKKNSNIHKHNSESKRHICPHHDHIILQAFSFKSPSQILTDSEDDLSVLSLLFLIYRLGLMAPMFPSDASEERGGELGSVWSKPLSTDHAWPALSHFTACVSPTRKTDVLCPRR